MTFKVTSDSQAWPWFVVYIFVCLSVRVRVYASNNYYSINHKKGQ